MEEKKRRARLFGLLPNSSIAIIFAAELRYRNSNVEFQFRQNSDFWYLTGLNEPGAICVLIKENNNKNEFILFIQPKIKQQELWTGKRIGIQNAKKIYQANNAYTIEKLDEIMPQLLFGKETIFFPIGKDPDCNFDKKIINWLQQARSKKNNNPLPTTFKDLTPILAHLRLNKSKQELALIKQAAEISVTGHLELINICRPGLYEYQLSSQFINHCCQHGGNGTAYPCIVASGNNACTLHYTKNSKKLGPKDLVLIDAGCEYQNYAADITRTLPISGKFSKEQKIIYDIVLQAQLAALKKIKPASTLLQAQLAAVKIIVNKLIELKILRGKTVQLIKNKAYKRFYPHFIGHWLGLDVHDVGDPTIPFKAGMMLTIEPGLYFPKDDPKIPKKWQGIGVRIEDMVLVTKDGHAVLTANLPKNSNVIENIMQEKND